MPRICNCTACRRCGALWVDGYDNHEILVSAPPDGLVRYIPGKALSFDFCRT